MNDTKSIAINDLQPIAARLRERQEQILHDKNVVLAGMGNVIALISEQGRDIVLAKTKLGKQLKWSEWLHAHVPNMDEDTASKCERVATEQISDIRQCIFAFLPKPERLELPERAAPAAWESVWGYVRKVQAKITEVPMDKWPELQVDLTRKELKPLARMLWPDRFE